MSASATAAPLILVINPGATSTKVALYQGAEPLSAKTVRHDDGALASCGGWLRQLAMRMEAIEALLEASGLDADRLDAVVARGGLLRPLTGGTYLVDDVMVDDLCSAMRGEHASNLGALMAREIAAAAGVDAYVVDPVSVDEMAAPARLSGIPDIERDSLSHALNMKAVSKRYARSRGRAYDSLRLVVAHLGTGISIAAHRDGRMVDVLNPMEEGPFSMDRAGGLPAMKLVNLALSGQYSAEDLKKRIFGEGGVFAYLGTRDFVEVERRIEAGDERARLVVEAFVWQISKGIGSLAVLLGGPPDAIILTGGLANAASLTERIVDNVSILGPVEVMAGEDEMLALAEGVMRVLEGVEKAKSYALETAASRK